METFILTIVMIAFIIWTILDYRKDDKPKKKDDTFSPEGTRIVRKAQWRDLEQKASIGFLKKVVEESPIGYRIKYIYENGNYWIVTPDTFELIVKPENANK